MEENKFDLLGIDPSGFENNLVIRMTRKQIEQLRSMPDKVVVLPLKDGRTLQINSSNILTEQ